MRQVYAVLTHCAILKKIRPSQILHGECVRATREVYNNAPRSTDALRDLKKIGPSQILHGECVRATRDVYNNAPPGLTRIYRISGEQK